MKKLASTVITIILLVILSPKWSIAQAFRSSEENVAIELYNRTTDEYYTFYAKMERVLITSSGNFLRTVSLKIDKDAPVMNFPGPIKIYEVNMYYDIDGDGTNEKITDTMAVLNRSGNLKFVYHNNGAGNRLPRGW